MPTVAFVSFRFGRTDGVSIVSRQWMEIFAAMGYRVVTVAGEGSVDHVVGGLAIDAPEPPTDDQLDAALGDADLVVVENLCTIPLNVPAALAVGRALAGRPAIMHHHDPPWHRDRFAHVTELPLDDPSWRHVTINEITAAEMAERGLRTTVIHNGFSPPGPADRAARRLALGVEEHEILVLHPVRAIERKNIPAAIALCEALGATYWLLGPAEEGYGPTLDLILAEARCRVLRAPCADIDDAYAASDLVAFPSTWEGFGNPPIEAALRRRPCAVGDYPFAAVLRDLGMRFLPPSDPTAVRSFLDDPDLDLLDRNERVATRHFSLDRVAAEIHTLLATAGWSP